MDIVDTFNHLIPSEHLDDAIFLGDNLETEGCDEFTTSQHVVEDSLKNMLSDKDPMLGSASTQFCLPVLDSTEPSFQIPTTTGVCLDDIMDVGVDKVVVNDVEDLILSDTNVNKLDEPSRKSVRKSPRLKVQESTRSLRQSTVEKSLNIVKVSSPKKTRYSRKDPVVDTVKEEELVLQLETNDIRSKGAISLEEPSSSPVSARRSTRITNKELKDKIIIGENETEEYTSPVNNKGAILGKEVNRSETLNDGALILLNENDNNVADEMTENDSSHSEGQLVTDQALVDSGESKECQEYQAEDKKTDIIYDKVHQELALLSGIDVHLDVKSMVLPEVNDEYIVQNADLGSTQDGNGEPSFIASEVLDPSNNLITETDTSIVEIGAQDHPEIWKSENIVQENEVTLENDNNKKKSFTRKGVRKVKPTLAKKTVSEENTGKNLVASKDASLNTIPTKARTKVSKNPIPQSVNQPEKRKIVKVKKKMSEDMKADKVPLKKKLKKKLNVVGKRHNAPTPLKQLDEALRENQGSLKEVEQVVSSHSRSRSLSHSSDKAVSKQTSSSKGSNLAKDDGERREATEQSEERAKLKKSLPPRQRRSSKSISVEEPPLFIPDNFPAIKKEGTDVTSPTDKYIWNPTRHCSSCRKLHGNRFMVGCGRCDDWFHGECVGLTLAQAQQMEVDDKEYICAKCCAEEEKMDIPEADLSSDNSKTSLHQDLKSLENDKTMTESHSLPQEKSKPSEETMKNKEHKVKISKKIPGDARHSTENKDSDIKRQHTSNRKSSATAVHRVSEERREKPSKDSATASTHDEKTTKSGVIEKIDVKKRKTEKKGSSGPVASPSTPKPSVEQIRQSVCHSLKDILVKRLSESSSKIPEERATKVSAKIEKELFSFYRDTDAKYKNKYRSLMFNLKDPKNNVLYKRVLKGDITPEHLIKMTPEELASRELAAWRQRENRHTIEMIEKEQREKERRPITKITHKGEIEIENQAPMKEPEAMDTEESVAKPPEKEDEVPKEKEDPAETTSDTTAQHKNHLFDLNCKICIGRMAPPAEDLSPKKAKLSTSVMRIEAENVTEAASTVPGSLDIDMLETERLDSPKDTFFSATSSESFNITDTAEDESTFLARLTYIWKGFLNMPSVAKFMIKAYPVSGSLEHLSEDLPESIQVGGRISPQTVWDYVEKIRASGTKETCVIRFTPETEEDQISYTLLYSYFSSRKRYGVVANNMRQVKDMYLIPLGASEKIPHFFVPFDGPGLEGRRPNLLLALIIRQKVKRQHSTSIDDEHLGSILNVPEKKNKLELDDDEDDGEEDDENDFFNSFTTVLHKNRNRAQLSETEEPQPAVEPIPEAIKREPPKPLRFLPGVLVGWENPESTLDLANEPLPVDDILQSLLGTTENNFTECKSPSKANNDKPLKEEKNQVIDESITSEKSLDIEMNIVSSTVEEKKDNPAPITTLPESSLGLSLKDKPPDVSTEAFLTKVNVLDEEMVHKNLSAEEADVKNNVVPNSNMTSIPVTKGNDDNNVASVDVSSSPVKSPKVIHSKRDPRQAAGRGIHINTSDIKDLESDSHQNKDSTENASRHKKDKSRKHSREETDISPPKSRAKTSLSFSSSTDVDTDIGEESNTEKKFPPDLRIDETDPLQQFRRALAANKSQTQTSNTLHSENSSKNPAPAFSGNFSPLRLPQPSFLPLNTSPPPFPFQHAPGFPLQGSPMFPYAPHIPPLLPTPLGMGFPRPPRFQSVESSIHNPLVAWHPALQLTRQPPHFFGHVPTGPLLNTEHVRYQAPQKLYHRDHRSPERRHSDPWEKQSDRSSSRGSRSEHRQRFYSESHHSRDKRHEKDSGSDKHGDKDSERSRRRDRDKERSHDRDRKSRDESHREKERSRTSHSDKSSDSRTSKEGRNDKSKSEDRTHDKEKSRDRNRDRDEEKDRDRHHRDRNKDHSDKTKSKR